MKNARPAFNRLKKLSLSNYENIHSKLKLSTHSHLPSLLPSIDLWLMAFEFDLSSLCPDQSFVFRFSLGNWFRSFLSKVLFSLSTPPPSSFILLYIYSKLQSYPWPDFIESALQDLSLDHFVIASSGIESKRWGLWPVVVVIYRTYTIMHSWCIAGDDQCWTSSSRTSDIHWIKRGEIISF